MYLAYVDESGNSGPNGSRTYTLGCVLVEDQSWPWVFDQLIGYRRFVRRQYGLPVRAEIKANYLIRNGGPFRHLRLGNLARYSIYRGMMRLQPKLGLLAFAIVINKATLAARHPGRDARDVAWEFLLQRLERFTTQSHKKPVLLVHDEGESLLVKRLARKARRAGTAGSHFGTGTLRRPASLLIDDPVPRMSRESYFVQLADLTAYAAFRRVNPPLARPALVAPATLWDELDRLPGQSAIYRQANQLAGGIPGIVAWP